MNWFAVSIALVGALMAFLWYWILYRFNINIGIIDELAAGAGARTDYGHLIKKNEAWYVKFRNMKRTEPLPSREYIYPRRGRWHKTQLYFYLDANQQLHPVKLDQSNVGKFFAVNPQLQKSNFLHQAEVSIQFWEGQKSWLSKNGGISILIIFGLIMSMMTYWIVSEAAKANTNSVAVLSRMTEVMDRNTDLTEINTAFLQRTLGLNQTAGWTG